MGILIYCLPWKRCPFMKGRHLVLKQLNFWLSLVNFFIREREGLKKKEVRRKRDLCKKRRLEKERRENIFTEKKMGQKGDTTSAWLNCPRSCDLCVQMYLYEYFLCIKNFRGRKDKIVAWSNGHFLEYYYIIYT